MADMTQSTTVVSPKKKLRFWIVRFLQKMRLSQVVHHFYYRYIHSFNTASPDVLPALQKSLNKLIELGLAGEGDYCEFGIFKGYAFWHAQRTATLLGFHKMQLFGFDSFEGLPDITTSDQTSHNEFYKGQYSCSKKKVEENLNKKGIDWEKTVLIEGIFSSSLATETKDKYGINKVTLALIDCDLYVSTIEVLIFLSDIITDGTILIFDDWNCFNQEDNRGQRRAFREFLDTQKEWEAQSFFSYGLYGHVFIMRRR